jgi:hypothetical protein
LFPFLYNFAELTRQVLMAGYTGVVFIGIIVS